MNYRRILIALLSFSMVVFVYSGYRYRLDIVSVLKLFESRQFLTYFLFACALLFIGHFIRAYKLKRQIDIVHTSKLSTGVRALFIGYLFDLLLPFRLGQVIRAIVLGAALKISASYIFSLILLERAVDGLILGTFSLLVLNYSYPLLGVHLEGYSIFSISLIAFSAIILSFLYFLRAQNTRLLLIWHRLTEVFNQEYKDKSRLKMWSVIFGLQKTVRKDNILSYILMSLVMWVFYFSATFILASYFFSMKDVYVETIRAIVPYMGLAIPFGPAYLGVFYSFTGPILSDLFLSTTSYTYLISSWFLLIIPSSIVGIIATFKTREMYIFRKKSIAMEDKINKLSRKSDTSQDLSVFLDAYFSGNTLSRILHNIEVTEDVKLVQYFKGGSDASTILVHSQGEYWVRKITPSQHMKKLKNQHDWLKSYSSLNNIVNVSNPKETENYYSFDIEYYQGFVPYFEYIHTQPIEKSEKILTDIFTFMFSKIYSKKKPILHSDNAEKYINKRCIEKVKQATQLSPSLAKAIAYPTLVINKKKYYNIEEIITKIKTNEKAWQDISTYSEGVLHGDLTVDNILASTAGSKFKIIDPTDENEISSAVVDFGRQYQSLTYGYEFLCRDDSKVTISSNHIDFINEKSSQYADLNKLIKKIAKKHLSSAEYRSILFHTGVMYSRMLTHRVHINPDNILKFYAISVVALNDFYEQYKG